MGPTNTDWQLYRSFLAVVQEGSLSGAARRLGLTQPTLGRQIAQLEEGLGLALFTRSPAGLQPTAAARALFPYAEAMASAAEALARAASGAGDASQGTIRLTAGDFVSAEVLPPILRDFQNKHRGIVIELSPSNRIQDLLRHDADIAVRMTTPKQDALVAKRIGVVKGGLYAHRRYIAQRGTPRSLDDLDEHVLIGIDRDDSSIRGVEVPGVTLTRDLFSFRCDNDLVQLAAMRAGAGIGGCHDRIARRDDTLVPILPGVIRFQLEMWLVTHEDLKTDPRVRLLFDHLAEALTEYVKDGSA
jgi:DNA-binding transcriptional LysR family regulator